MLVCTFAPFNERVDNWQEPALQPTEPEEFPVIFDDFLPEIGDVV
jgi:hypothetical protein